MSVNDRQKSNISTLHALGMSVSYDRVIDIRRGLGLAVSRRFAEDGVVAPSNIRRGVFTTGGVDNIDESGGVELHGTAVSLTNHLTHDNKGVDPLPLMLDTPEGATIQLSDDFYIVPYIDEYVGEINLSAIPKGTATITVPGNRRVGVPAEVWMNHLHNILTKKEGKLDETPVTYSGFFSHGQDKEHVRPRAAVGVFPYCMRRPRRWPCRIILCSWSRRQ